MVSKEITEHKAAEETLSEERDLAERYLNIVEVIIVALDTHARITLLNRKGYQVLGYEEGELLGKDWIHTCLRPQDGRRVHETNRKINAGEIQAFEYYENYVLTKKGEERFIAWHTTILKDENGLIIGTLSSGEDITERKMAEKKVKESEEKYRQLVENSLMGICLSKGNQVTFANSAILRIFGYDNMEEFLKIPLIDHVAPESQELIATSKREISEGKSMPFVFEYTILRKDGTTRILRASLSHVTIGGEIYTQTTFQDITEQKQAEEDLRSSHQILEGIINAIPIRVFWKDRNSIFLGCNKIFAQDAGFADPKDIVGKDDYLMGWRDQAELYRADDRQVIERGLQKLLIEEPQTTPDGNTLVLLTSKIPLRSPEGEIIGVLGTYMDITERKKMEKTLQESEDMYKAIFENTGTATMIIEDNTIISLANSEFERLTGYSKEEIEGKISWTEFIIKEDLERMLEQHKLRRIDPKAALDSYEFRAIDKNGNVKDILMRAGVIPGTKKSIASLLDITKSKRTEDELKKIQSRLRVAMDLVKLVQWEYDVETDLFTFDDQFYALYGTTAEREGGTLMSSQDYARKFIPPEEAPLVAKEISKSLATTDPNFFGYLEHRIIRGDGTEGFVAVRYGVVKDKAGHTIGTYGANQDITDRKLAEKALKDSESKLASTIDFLPDATLVIDSEKKIIAWNRAMEEMTGVSKDDMIGKGDYAYTIPFYGERRSHLLDLLDIEDKDLASKYQYVKRKGNTLYAETYTPALYEGKGAYVWATGAPLFDNKGNRIGAIESIRDITEFKKADRTLREQLNFLQQLIDSIPNPIFYKDINGVYLGCNTAFETITGYSRDRIVGRTVYELYSKEFADVYSEADKKLFQNPGVQIYEAAMAHTDGSRHDVMFNKATYFDTEGRLAGLVGVILDITERKHMEIALKKSERRLADIINFLPDATLVIDKDGRVIAWNRAIEALTEIKAEDILGKGDYEYALPFYSEKRPMLIDLALEPHPEIENRYSDLKWVDGTIVGYTFTPKVKGVGAYIWGVASPIYDPEGRVVGAIESMKDITEQRRMEKALQESKDYLNKIINSIGDPLFVKDRQHSMTLVNDAACKLFGRQREELIGKTIDDLFSSKEMADISWMKDEEVFNKGIEATFEETNTFADKTLTVLVKKTPYTDNAGNQFLVGITRDITDRKQAEDRILASLHEKEILLKEVHHRVKNNLQVISALLYLQSSNLTDENIIKIFRDSQDRIKSMALIHENLYRSKDLGKVNFYEYINQLISYLSQSYGDISRKINFKVNSENVFLNINTAIPCGMIINELVSNSLKHAFKDGRSGEICIDISSENDGFKLIVSDNGVGIKGDINIENSKTLGFRLIDTLVKQIDGKMSLDTTNRFRCEIRFKGLK